MSLPISVGSGATVGTEIIGGAHYGFNKIVGGQSGATIGWKINTDGSGQVAIGGNVTLSDPKGYIGLVTVGNTVPVTGSFYQATQPVSIGNLTLDPGSQTQIIGNITLANSKNFIGLVTVGNIVTDTLVGNVTLDAGSKTGIIGNVTIDSIANAVALKGNLTISDSKQFIGLVSVSGFQNPLPVSFSGNVTLSDSKGFIGLTTSVIGSSATIFAVVNTSASSAGNVTLDAGSKTGLVGTVTIQDGGNSITIDGNVGITGNVSISSNVAWPDPKGYIGLVTITGSLAAAAGNITLDAGSFTGIKGNVTLTDSKGFVGLVSVSGFTNPLPVSFAGNITIDSGVITTITNPVALKGNVTIDSVANPIALKGNVTISDSKQFIGLVSVSGFANPLPVTFSGNVTIDSGTITTITNPVALKGNVTIDSGSVSIKGNVTISDSKGFVGLVSVSGFTTPLPVTFSGNVTLDVGSLAGLRGNVTLDAGSKTQIVGNVSISSNVAWADPKGYIGLVTITGSLAAAAGNITLDDGSLVGITGNVTISDSKGFIGLVTIGGGTAWADPKGYIGLVTITGSLAAAAGNVTLDVGSLVGLRGNITLTDSKLPIGTVSVLGGIISLRGNLTLDVGSLVGIRGNITIQDGGNTITTDIIGNVTISDSKGFIGLVTAVVAFTPGTGKTLVNLPISFLSAGSQATIVVPGTNTSVYITNMLLNSDASVRVNIKSGVTYLTGNASVGITLNPGGGFVMSGSVDSPVWIGCPSGALIVEKLDLTGTSAKIGGNVVYFTQ
jgi:hypothetical protein